MRDEAAAFSIGSVLFHRRLIFAIADKACDARRKNLSHNAAKVQRAAILPSCPGNSALLRPLDDLKSPSLGGSSLTFRSSFLRQRVSLKEVCGSTKPFHLSSSRFISAEARTATAAASQSTTSSSKRNPQIVILGGGFGGLYSALRLTQYPWQQGEEPDITLVDQNERFVFSPLLYEILSKEVESWEIAPSFSELLYHSKTARFLRAAVDGIDLDAKTVHLSGRAEPLEYDRLVIALGGEANCDMVPGAKEHSLAFRTLADAQTALAKLQELEKSTVDPIRVVIIGGGYSGVELACTLADRLGNRGYVQLVDSGDRIMKTSSDHNRQAALRALKDRGAWVDLNVVVKEVGPDSVTLLYTDGQTDIVPANLIFWTAASKVSRVVAELPLERTTRGQVITSPTLQVPGYPEVSAVGDLAFVQGSVGEPVPMSAQAAMQQADYIAWNVWASLTGRQVLPFRFTNLGEMLTLGRSDATIFSGLLPGGFALEGPLAAAARRVAYLARLPTLEHQVRVGISWLQRPLSAAFDSLSTQVNTTSETLFGQPVCGKDKRQ